MGRFFEFFKRGEQDSRPQPLTLLSIDGIVAVIPLELDKPSPVPGMSTVVVDELDGSPGTRFWVRATDEDGIE